MPEPELPDTDEMVVLHSVFRRELEAGPARVAGVAAGDLERAGLVGAHYRVILELLSVHHIGEDLLLWPKLQDRDPGSRELLDRMRSQHGQLAETLPGVRERLAAWSTAPDPEHARELTAALERLLRVLDPHLSAEEADALPRARQHLSGPEWRALREHSLRSVAPEWHSIVLGLCLGQLPADRRGSYLAGIPAPVIARWRAGGQRKFEDHMERLGAASA